MEELLLKCAEKAQRPAASAIRPPVPAKDGPFRSPQRPAYASARAGHRPGRLQKGFSGEVNYDKENEVENKESPKKKPRGPHAGDGAPVQPKQVLSPASSNSRLNAGRPVSPTKSQIARPGSPLKGPSRTAAATTMLSNFVEKAKSSRAGGTKKMTTASNTGINSTPVAPSARTRRGPAPKPPTSRPATRTGRRISANSETSEGSNATVIRKGAASRTGAANTKKTMGTFTKGTASVDAKRTPAAKSAAASTTRTGRVLRNRGEWLGSVMTDFAFGRALVGNLRSGGQTLS